MAEPPNGEKLVELQAQNVDDRFKRLEARLDKGDAFGATLIRSLITAVIAAIVAYLVSNGGMPPPV